FVALLVSSGISFFFPLVLVAAGGGVVWLASAIDKDTDMELFHSPVCPACLSSSYSVMQHYMFKKKPKKHQVNIKTIFKTYFFFLMYTWVSAEVCQRKFMQLRSPVSLIRNLPAGNCHTKLYL
uniref:Uncharacterized protein n=1 Tax=Xiphophorus couchianus TaxID=32473 RepID=A0A3B5LYM8_9TELE